MKRLKERVHNPRTVLHIGGLKEEEKTRFMDFAREEFDGKWSFALKWLMDFRDGLLTSPNEALQAQLVELRQDFDQLKELVVAQINEQQEGDMEKRMDGRKVKKHGKQVEPTVGKRKRV